MTDVSDDPPTDATPNGTADEGRLDMNEGTATLTVKVGDDEYQFVYAMTADENRTRQIVVNEGGAAASDRVDRDRGAPLAATHPSKHRATSRT